MNWHADSSGSEARNVPNNTPGRSCDDIYEFFYQNGYAFLFSCIGGKEQLYFGSLDQHGYVGLVVKLKAQMRMWFWVSDQRDMFIYLQLQR